MTDPTDVVRETNDLSSAGHRQMCRVGQGDYPHKEHKAEVCTPGHAIIDALRDIALRLAEESTAYKSDGAALVTRVSMLADKNARLKAEVERLKEMRPCSPGLTHRSDCEAASDEPEVCEEAIDSEEFESSND